MKISRKTIICSTLISFFLTPYWLHAITPILKVSTNGDFTTIQAAYDYAKTLQTEVTITVGEGSYYLSTPLLLSDSKQPIHFVADGKVILSGAQRLTLSKWTQDEKGVYTAETEKGLAIDQLFINGEQQILARYPNFDPTQPLQGATTQQAIKQRSRNWKEVKGGYIRALHDRKWGGNSYRILSKADNEIGLRYEWVGDNNRGNLMHPDFVMVENLFEELDAEKEWYYNSETGKLSLKPSQSLFLNENTVVEAVTTPELIHISRAANITFTGFTLEKTSRTLFTGKYVPLMRSDWCVVRSGALFIEKSQNITFEKGNIQNIGGNAIFISDSNERICINNNKIENIGSSGILLVGHPDSCREASFWGNHPSPETHPYSVHKTTIIDKSVGPKAERYPKDCLISNNHIKNIGIWEKQSSHIALSVASRIRILQNTLNIGPRAAINVGDGTFGGHEIAYNDVFDVQLETDDHGMFNSWGRDRFWSYRGFDTMGNRGRLKEPLSRLDCYQPILIHDNRFHFGGRIDGGSTFGIDLDDGSSNYKIYNNLCLNMGIKLREGFHREVYNNIIINGALNLHCTFENSYDQIRSNILFFDHPISLAGTNKLRFQTSKNIIDHNCYWNNKKTIQFPNFWLELYDSHSIIENRNPLFKDPANLDFTVTNKTLAKQIEFNNFSMAQFGQPNCKESCPHTVRWNSNLNILNKRIELMGATFTNVTDAIMSSTGAGSLKGAYLETLPKNSVAKEYGLEPDDVIHFLNEIELKSVENLKKEYDKILIGEKIQLRIIRNQKEKIIQFIKK